MEVKSPTFKNFLEKYIGKCDLNRSKIRIKYVSTVYENTISYRLTVPK